MLQMKCTAKCTAVNKKTRAQLWQNVIVGDILEFVVDIKRAGIRRGRTYSTGIKIKNERTKEVTYESFNTIDRYINDIFTFEQLKC